MRIVTLIFAITIASTGYGQWQGTNPVYFTAGNVGIGETSPTAKLSFKNITNSTVEDGITWYSPDPLSYGIYRTPGSWTSPVYQQLKVNFATGIILNPGSGWTKSYVDIQGGGLRVTGGNVGVGTTSPQKKLEVIIPANDFVAIGSQISAGQYNGLQFGYLEATNGLYRKSALAFEMVDAAARGKIHFLNNGVFNNSSATLADSKMTIDFNGYVGIGTSAPTAKLDIALTTSTPAINILGQGTTANQIFIQGSDFGGRVFDFSDGNGGNSLGGFAINGYRRSDNPGIYLIGKKVVANGAGSSSTEGSIDFKSYTYSDQNFTTLSTPNSSHPAFKFKSNDSDLFTLTTGGNVGIGTTSPNQKLTVNGTIYGKEVKVDLSVPGPDYVFANNYQLLTLNELKTYIDQNKHLPEVPSAKEMEEKGIQLGEMNMLLLKKMEEMTLYMIDLKEENDQLKTRIEKIENRK